jgi:sigma-B regulation protein RsbU (phosphoserine phosphatase)
VTAICDSIAEVHGRAHIFGKPTGPAVGLMAGMPFETAVERLEPGEALVAYSDGVVDARDPDPDGAGFGWDRLVGLVERGGPAAELVGRIRDALARHTAGADDFDDSALLALRRR